MIETVLLISSIILWGAFLGMIYFTGLWLTIQRLATSQHPALLMVASLFVRTSIVLAGFYPIIKLDWVNSLYCLSGFLLARFIITRRLKLQITSS